MRAARRRKCPPTFQNADQRPIAADGIVTPSGGTRQSRRLSLFLWRELMHRLVYSLKHRHFL